MNKKALETILIVGLIVIVITAGILVYFIATHFRELPGDETCHQAVVYRGSLYEAAASTQVTELLEVKAVNMISLKCKQKNVIIDSADEKEIMRQIADEMARCWSILGEGKVNFFGRALTDRQQCLICSRITFSERARQAAVEIDGKEFSDFLSSELMTGKEDVGLTYSDFFAGAKEHQKYEKYSEKLSEDLKKQAEEAMKARNIDAGDTNYISTASKEGYAIIYMLWTKDQITKIVSAGAAGTVGTIAGAIACYGVGAALTGSGVGTIAGLIIMASCTSAIGAGSMWLGSAVAGAVDSWTGQKYIAGMSITPYNPKELMKAGSRGQAEMACTGFNNIPD